MGTKQELKEIWEDTEQQLKENPTLRNAVEKSIHEQRFFINGSYYSQCNVIKLTNWLASHTWGLTSFSII